MGMLPFSMDLADWKIEYIVSYLYNYLTAFP